MGVTRCQWNFVPDTEHWILSSYHVWQCVVLLLTSFKRVTMWKLFLVYRPHRDTGHGLYLAHGQLFVHSYFRQLLLSKPQRGLRCPGSWVQKLQLLRKTPRRSSLPGNHSILFCLPGISLGIALCTWLQGKWGAAAYIHTAPLSADGTRCVWAPGIQGLCLLPATAYRWGLMYHLTRVCIK